MSAEWVSVFVGILALAQGYQIFIMQGLREDIRELRQYVMGDLDEETERRHKHVRQS